MASSNQNSLPLTTAGGKNHLVGLPAELLASILSHLPNCDIKSLRLTCGFFHATAKLRLNRIFLSANPRDVEVFRAIADHETFRKGIIEIIWDDAVIREPELEEFDSEEEIENRLAEEADGCPLWFSRECEENNFNLKGRYQYDILDRPDRAIAAQLPLRESWAYFRQLRSQQQDVISTGADAAALRHGLARFPSLHTITITPAAHGNLLFPLYETPTIRAFPCGFNYPIPRGWPTTGEGEPVVKMPPWADEDGGSEDERDKWRGFRIVMRTLTQQAEEHRVSELILNAHQLDTGLNCRIFERPCPEYHDLVVLLRRPGFRRLDLSLAVGGQEFLGWPAFRSTFLKRALSEIGPDLEHLSLTTDVHADLDTWTFLQPSGGRMSHYVPLLSTVFPIDRWPCLRHFGLSGFLVTQEDLLSLLSALPATLRSLELGNLYFLDGVGHWRGLLDDMRDRLGWRDRPANTRPRVAIRVGEIDNQRRSGRAVWVDADVAKFLYGDGKNPFGRHDGEFPTQVNKGHAGVVRDAFDPEFERPYVEPLELMQMGYIKKSPFFFPEVNRGSSS